MTTQEIIEIIQHGINRGDSYLKIAAGLQIEGVELVDLVELIAKEEGYVGN